MRVHVLSILAFSSPWYAYPIKDVLLSIHITNHDAQLITGILQMWNLFWALLAASLVDRVGRRTLFMTSIAGTIVFLSLLTACSTEYVRTGHQAAAYAFITFIFLFYSFFNLAFPTLLVSYAVEIYPYSLRAKGFAYYNFVFILASIFGSYVRLPFGLGKFSLNLLRPRSR